MPTVALLLLACTPSTPTDSAEPDTDVPMATADTAPPPPVWPWQLDCETLPELPTTFTELPIAAAEDFSFDLEGNLIGISLDGNLQAQTMDGSATLIAPNIGTSRGARVLPDGSVAVALVEQGRIERVLPSGERLPLADVPAPNGIALDLFNTLWVTTSVGLVVRVAMDGTTTNVVDVGVSLDGIAFSPDYRRMFFNSEEGEVGVLEIGEDGEPVGEPTLFATVPLQGFAILDGMTTDQCGNLYVLRMDGRVYRYTPDGSPAGLLQIGTSQNFVFMPALNFGSGFGGFERDKLYVIDFDGGLYEADIGIQGRWDPYYPIPE